MLTQTSRVAVSLLALAPNSLSLHNDHRPRAAGFVGPPILAFAQPENRIRGATLRRPSSTSRAATMSVINVHGGAASTTKGDKGGKAGLSGSTFNLIKNIVGSGILALPGGVAAFSHAKGATVPAAVITAFLGLLSGYCFSLIGRSCAATGSKTYGEAWAATVNPKTTWLPVASVIAKTFFACLSYSIIIGDTFSTLGATFGLPKWISFRPAMLSAITSVVLLPLCLLKDLGPLRYTSILGVAGTFFTAAVMILRYLDGTYAPGGRFFGEAAAGLFSGSAAINPLTLILVSMLSTSFIAHYNAPRFYHELKDKSIGRYNKVVGASFGTSIALFIIMTIAPFLTFGGSCQGFILNNYAISDRLATFSRLAIGASIVFGYPLTFITAREGLMNALKLKSDSDSEVALATVGLLGAFTGMAMVLRDLGFVVAFGGALLGSAVIYVFPAMMWICKCRSELKTEEGRKALVGWRKAEYMANYGIVGLGSFFSIVGATICVLKQFVW